MRPISPVLDSTSLLPASSILASWVPSQRERAQWSIEKMRDGMTSGIHVCVYSLSANSVRRTPLHLVSEAFLNQSNLN